MLASKRDNELGQSINDEISVFKMSWFAIVLVHCNFFTGFCVLR